MDAAMYFGCVPGQHLIGVELPEDAEHPERLLLLRPASTRPATPRPAGLEKTESRKREKRGKER
jgi:hypothetical protein